jgi:hypothetical protein
MRVFRMCVFLALASAAATVVAQTAASLPTAMSGRWSGTYPRGTFSDEMSVVLESPDAAGAVTGRLTYQGLNCGAVDEPLTGTWNGTELRFESQLRPNVNTKRMNGQCGTGRTTFVLTRKPGQTGFEGESRTEGTQVPDQITLSP